MHHSKFPGNPGCIIRTGINRRRLCGERNFRRLRARADPELVWRGMRLPLVMESLESRRLLSLSVDMRIDVGNAAIIPIRPALSITTPSAEHRSGMFMPFKSGWWYTEATRVRRMTRWICSMDRWLRRICARGDILVRCRGASRCRRWSLILIRAHSRRLQESNILTRMAGM